MHNIYSIETHELKLEYKSSFSNLIEKKVG
jgi:hypothetical protein